MDVGTWVGLFSGLGGVVVAIVVVVISVLTTLLSVVLPIGFVIFFFRMLAKGAQAERELLEKGTPAPATIVSLAQTGTYLNNHPQVAITLSVAMPDGELRTVTVRKFLSIVQIAQLQIGRVIEVRYDPADPSKVAIAGL